MDSQPGSGGCAGILMTLAFVMAMIVIVLFLLSAR